MASRGPRRMDQPERRATPRAHGDESGVTAGGRAMRPAAPQPNTTQPLWRRLPIILGAASGIGLCLIVLLLSFLLTHAQPTPPDPTPTARTLCADLQAHDYTATYALLSTRLRAQGTATQFAASQRRLDIERGQVTSCAPTIQHADAAQAAVSLTLTRGTATTTQAASVTLINESGSWKVDAYDPALI
ncbi:MAG: hypothetical protein ACXVCX_21940 [Ktedonobacterales bacterium]